MDNDNGDQVTSNKQQVTRSSVAIVTQYSSLMLCTGVSAFYFPLFCLLLRNFVQNKIFVLVNTTIRQFTIYKTSLDRIKKIENTKFKKVTSAEIQKMINLCKNEQNIMK